MVVTRAQRSAQNAADWSEWATTMVSFALDYLYEEPLVAIVPRVNTLERIMRRLSDREARVVRLIDVVSRTPLADFAGAARVLQARNVLRAQLNANNVERSGLRGRINALRAEITRVMPHPSSMMPEMPVVAPDPGAHGRRALKALEATRFTVHLIDSALLFGELVAPYWARDLEAANHTYLGTDDFDGDSA